jgi:Domain of unknown function (DUF5658)
MLALVVALLALTITDGILTLELLSMDSEEANPFMRYLLHRGPLAFLLGKYLLTAFGLPVLVVCGNHPMFGSRFRVGFLLPVFIGLYVVLIAYQLTLFHAGDGHSPSRAPDRIASMAPGHVDPIIGAARPRERSALP